MAEFPTLGIRVENGQAVRAIEGLNAAFDKTTKKVEESRVKFDAWQQTTAASVAPVTTLRASTEGLAKAKDGATLSASRLRGGLTNLASSVIGLNPQVSQLTSVIGSFALGSGLMIGVLAGVAALGYAYNKLTEDSRKFKEQTDKLIESLVKQKQAAFDATAAGREASVAGLLLAETRAQAALQRLDDSGPELYPGQRKAFVKAYQDAQVARLQAEADAKASQKRMQDDAWEAGIKEIHDRDAIRKEWSDAEKKAYDERERRQKEHLARLVQNAELAGRQVASFAGLDLPDINLPRNAIPGQSGAFINLGGIGGLTGSSFAVPGGLGGPTAQNYQQRQAAEQNRNLLLGQGQATAKATEGVNRMAMATQIAANTIGNAATAIASKAGNGSIASTFGGGLGQAGASMLGGFGGTAFGQAIFGPILGAFGSAIGQSVDIMFDFSGAAQAARIALANMTRAVESNIASYEARAYGTTGSLADQIRQSQEMAAERRAEIEARYRADAVNQFWHGTDPRIQRDEELARIDAAEKADIARLKEADAIKATTEALNAFTTSVRNAPSGFKVESYINRFAAARPWDYNGGPMSMPFSPQGGPTSTGGARISMSGVTFKIEGNTGEALLKDLVNELRKKASVTVGGNAPLADALEYA